MSTNALATYQPQELARYAFLNPARDAVAGLKAAIGPKLAVTDLVKITIDNNGKLHIPTLGGDQIVESVEGVVVVNHLWRSLYPRKYNKKESGIVPRCTSNDGIKGVGDPGTYCDKCPFNVWGSANTLYGDGGKGKACKEFWHMYLWREGKKRPELLQVPSTSIGLMRQYMMSLLDLEELEELAVNDPESGEAVPMPILGVITRFTPQEIKGQWKIVPTVAGVLPEAVWGHTLRAADFLASMLVTPSRTAPSTATVVDAQPIDTEERQGLPQRGAARARATFNTDIDRPGYGEVKKGRSVPTPVPTFTEEELEAADSARETEEDLADIDL